MQTVKENLPYIDVIVFVLFFIGAENAENVYKTL